MVSDSTTILIYALNSKQKYCIFIIVSVLSLLCVPIFSQAIKAPLVVMSGSGETTYAPSGGFNYSHHTNYAVNIRSITAKWELRTLLGEPVIDGVFKWQAGEGTPKDYLDYNDIVLLECSPQKSKGYLVYISLMPTVPKSGEGYGFNTPGSPSWKNLFCTRSGESMTTIVPDFNANTAKEIWKNGFYVTGIVLIRSNGTEGYLQSIKENREAKYKALLNPFLLSVKNNDTVTSERIRLFKELDPYFRNSGIIAISKCKTTDSSYIVHSADEDLILCEGWNTLIYYLIKAGSRIKDSVYVYYSKPTRKVLLKDDFDDGILGGSITNAGYQGDYSLLQETLGYLLIKQGGEATRVIPRTREMMADPNHKVFIAFNSTLLSPTSCRDAWIKINDHRVVCRKNCNLPETVKIVWDIKNGVIQCFINGQLSSSNQADYYKQPDGRIQFEFSCYQFLSWQIDNFEVWQE